MIYIDTHIAVFLYQGDLSLFSKKAISILEKEVPILPAMAELELEYLYEIGKLQVTPKTLVKALQHEVGLKQCELSCHSIVEKARTLTWTRDPFDRMIVGNAMLAKKHLLTKDRIILKHFKAATW
jgi:PIN domain nuclease of toxin-antitoxin system